MTEKQDETSNSLEKGCMKKIFAILLSFWMAACNASSTSNSALQYPSATLEITQAPATDMFPSPSLTPSVTLTPSFTPPSATLAPAKMAATLIIPTLQTGSSVKLLSIQMIDAQTGWGIQQEASQILRPGFRGDPYLSRSEGYILRTLDGGKSWQNITPPTGAYSSGGLFAHDANRAWASENVPCCTNLTATRIWHTSDGGRSWQPSLPFFIAETGGEFFLPARMQFIDQNTGWLLASIEAGMGYSLREALFRTVDGGDTWERVNSFLEDLGVCGNGGLAFIDSKTGWYGKSCLGDGKTSLPFNTHFAGGGFNVRHTTDGGNSFSLKTTMPIPSELQELAATGPEMNCGERRVIAFTPEVVGFEWECELFWQPDQHYRYFSLSTDAGRNWNTWEPAGSEYFFNATHGWRLLAPGQLQQTTDSGLNWVTLKTVAWEGVQLDFVSEQEGWAVVSTGSENALVHTTDGGETWEEIKPVIVPQ